MAFEDGLISDHDGWRRMAKSRITNRGRIVEGQLKQITVK